MSIIGDISILMGVNTGGLKKGLGDARGQVGGFASGLGSLGKGLGDAGAGVGRFTDHTLGLSSAVAGLAGVLTAGALVGGLKSLVSGSINSIDAMADTADRVGTTTDALSKLQYAAKLTGSEVEAVAPALLKMSNNLSDAARAGGPAGDALKRLGLDAKTLIAQDPAAAFKEIAGAIASLPNAADQAAAAMDLFGKGGMQLLGTIKAGPEAIAKFEAEFAKLGGTLSQLDVAKVSAARDALDRVGVAVQGVGNTLTVALAPYLEAAANRFATFAAESITGSGMIEKGLDLVGTAIGGVADLFQVGTVVAKVFYAYHLKGMADFVDAISYVVLGIEVLEKKLGVVSETGAEMVRNVDSVRFAANNLLLQATIDASKPPPSAGIKKFFAGIKADADAAAKAMAEGLKPPPGLGDQFAETTKAIEEMTKKLEAQVSTFNKGSAAAEIFALKQKGATAEQLAGVEMLAKKLKKLEEDKKTQDELTAKAKSVTEEVRTPLDKFGETLLELQTLLSKGLISGDVMDKGLLKAKKELDEAGPKLDATPKLAGALELGSKEARSSVLQAQGLRIGDDPIKDVAKTNREQLVQLRQIAATSAQALRLEKGTVTGTLMGAG